MAFLLIGLSSWSEAGEWVITVDTVTCKDANNLVISCLLTTTTVDITYTVRDGATVIRTDTVTLPRMSAEALARSLRHREHARKHVPPAWVPPTEIMPGATIRVP